MQRRFGKLILFTDRARQHHRSIKVREYIEQSKDVLKVIYFPKGSSEFNPIEECWRQGKYDLLVSRYYPSIANFRHTIANYYRTRRFKLDIVKYLSRSMS
jgi:transposase